MPVKPLLAVSELSFSYGEQHVLDNLSFAIEAKDFIALIGPNGSGKTTLVKLLLGLLEPTAGRITRTVSTERIGYTPQRYQIDNNFPGTVAELLTEKDDAVIKQVGIADLMGKKFVNLSGGQQQKVLLALALHNNPKLLILDEPTTGIDVQSQHAFYDLLKRLHRQGIAIIIVTHEVNVLPTLVKKVLCIDHKTTCLIEPQEMPSALKRLYGEHFLYHHHGEDHQ